MACAAFMGLVGCSPERRQCRAVTAAISELRDDFIAARAAAELGNRALFAEAHARAANGVQRLATLDAVGESPSAQRTRAAQARAVAEVPPFLTAFERLLATTERNPALVKRFGGRPPLEAGVGNSPDQGQALSAFVARLTLDSRRSCGESALK